MTYNLKYFAPAVVALLGVLLYAGVALSATTFTTPTNTINTYKNFTFFSATTTTATSTNTADGSGYLVITGAKKVTMYFTHGGAATTSTTGGKFKVQTTRDGSNSNWDDFNKLIGADLSSTATSTYTIQGATTTVPVALDLSDDTFYAIRCISVEVASPAGTDGEQTCQASIEN
jgi:hypothetical protein